MQFGWFYDGHRALADCEACLALLEQIPIILFHSLQL